MLEAIAGLRHSLISKVVLTVGVTLLAGIAVWCWFSLRTQRESLMDGVTAEIDRLSNTIRLGAHYAMMLDSEEDIKEIIKNISRQRLIKTIRIYNKSGQVKFSNKAGEVDQFIDIQDKACYVCHQSDPPLAQIDLPGRTRFFKGKDGVRLVGVMSPIYNETSCFTDSCHVHPPGKKLLGLLDVVVSLEEADEKIAAYRFQTLSLAVFIFMAAFTAMFLFIYRFVNRPIRKLMAGTRQIARGDRFTRVDVDQDDEMGQLSEAINRMGKEVLDKHAELNRQRNQYQSLFEGVPCIITVQDRDYKLISFNREFSDKFEAKIGEYCYKAYKGRECKCEDCPVEKTFSDGRSHYSEEKGLDKDGELKHWIVTTSPIRDGQGKVVAAMEMCLDITPRKRLEERLAISEQKYHSIFNNIPNSVFVLDKETLAVIDCNDWVKSMYGYDKDELKGRSFLDLFREDERDQAGRGLLSRTEISRAAHLSKTGKRIFVSIKVAPTEYPGESVLLVTTSDITKRLETEQQLIQASKMATLGEMSTGVAHELNQPLSVIQTISSFLMRKINRNEPIDEKTFLELAKGVNSHVERAAKIINHMREFGRKSDLILEKVRVNAVLEKAFDIFSQQLKLRNIRVVWELEETLPMIMAEPNRLEQVFINLLINARDAIEDRFPGPDGNGGNGENGGNGVNGDKRITLVTSSKGREVVIKVCDTGTGIPKEIADKLFEPFFTTKEVGKGTGLGLSISYGIVKDYRGSIFAGNCPDGGACFTILFPAAEDGAAPDSRPEGAGPPL